MRIQFTLTVAQGKRLIARGICAQPHVQSALKSGKILIVGGSTNAYVADELLRTIGDSEGFDPRGFYRGMTVPVGVKLDKVPFIGDVVIENGQYVRGQSVFDAAPTLKAGDVVMKGGNAVNLTDREAAVLIGNPQGGTVIPVTMSAIGRRAKFLIPIGVEKRVPDKISDLALIANDPDTKGDRFFPMPGEIFTELDAISLLTGAHAKILASGGTLGAEGCCYFIAEGTDAQLESLKTLISEIEKSKEIAF